MNDLFTILSGLFLLAGLVVQSKDKPSELIFVLSFISFLLAVVL